MSVGKCYALLTLFLAVALVASACAPTRQDGAGGKLTVLTTTSIAGEVVANVAGDRAQVKVLLPIGADPHAFEPTPQDLALVSDAGVIFANGAGLEAFLAPLLASAGVTGKLYYLSDGVELRTLAQALAPAGEVGQTDPHVWYDPRNVLIWVDNIERTLGEADPANAQAYRDNAERYRAQLRELDAWIEQQVAQVPSARRELVTDHDALGYFAARFGFRLVGAVIPSFSTLAEPSAQDIAALEEAIRALGAPAVFVEQSVNSTLSRRVAQDTGVKLVYLYGGSLSEPNGPAATYVAYMRFNTSAIVDALR